MINPAKHTLIFTRHKVSIVLLLLIYAFIPFQSLNARNIDSLKNEIYLEAKGKDVFKLMDLASRVSTENLDLAIAYTSIALEKAIEDKNFSHVANIHREVAFYYENNNLLDSALVAYEKALTTAESIEDRPLQLVLYNDLAILYRQIGIYSQTKDYHLKSLELASEIGDKEMIEYSYHGLGFLFETVGDYDEAITHYFNSIDVAESRGSVSGVITTLQNIGTTYLKLDNHRMALATIEKAYNLATEENDTLHIANVLHDYGKILQEAGQLNNALDKLQAALEVYEKVNVKPVIARNIIQIAKIYIKKRKFDVAESYLERALTYKKFIRSQDFADLYTSWGNLYISKGDTVLAEIAYQNSLKISEDHQFKTISQETHKNLYEIYLSKGYNGKAVYHLKRYTELKDYIFNQEKASHIAEMQFRFDMEKNEKEIQLLQLRQNRTLLIGSSLFFAFVVLFLIYLIKMRGKNNSELMNKNSEIQSQNIKLRESNEVLNQFAYVAAHDLKEPLRNIGSFVDLIKIKYGHQFNEEALEYMGFVTSGVKRLNSLLIDLLEYSRISSQAATNEKLQISDTVKEVLANLKGIIKEKNAKIDFSDDLPAIRMSKLHLIQIFQNLISNALKFVDDTPEIKIDAQQINGDVVISVKDNGIGINKDFGNKIFNLFQQLNKTKKYEGTGIGLTICKNIIDKYDGRIWFDSEVNKGTTFYISIPNKDQRAFDSESETLEDLAELITPN